MVFLSIGGVLTHLINGGQKKHLWRIPIGVTHGVGLLLSLVGGFGLLARLGIVHGGLPNWVLVKLGIWTLFAVLIGLVYRKPSWSKLIWPLMITLGALAAYLAGSKPI